MDKKVFLYIVFTMLFIINGTFASPKYANKPNDLNYISSLEEYVLYVPAGITTEAVLSQEINSNTAITGQTINAILTDDFRYNNQLIASSGSILSGIIIFNKKAGAIGRNAQMQVRFTTITTPYNNIIPISAIIATKDSSSLIQGGSLYSISVQNAQNNNKFKTTEKKQHKTTLKGGLAVAKAIADKGESILIPSNTRITLKFDQPITLGAN